MHRLTVLSALLLPSLVAAQAPQVAPQTTDSVVTAPPTTLPLKRPPQRTTSAITTGDLMSRLYVFADDSMMGREAGTAGNVKGTDYIAAEVKRMGLAPAGDAGTYFQTIPLKTRTVDSASTLVVAGTPFKFGSEWAASGSASLAASELQAVFGGTLGDSSTYISRESTAGKLVVFRLTNGSPRLIRGAARIVPNAAAVAVIVPPQMLGFYRRPSTFVDDPTAAAPGASKPTLVLLAATAAKLFAAPLDSLTTGTAGRSANVSVVVKVEPVPFPARNVVAILRGSDAKLKGEYVAIGAHNDHIGTSTRPVDHDSIRIFNHIVRPGGADDAGNQASDAQWVEVNKQLAAWRAAHPGATRMDSISNGADDDGSGSVSVLEIAQKLAAMPKKPKRSVIFVWHVGEEKGLLGSAYFTDHPTVPRDSIVAQLNMDMVGRGDAWDVAGLDKDGNVIHGGPNYLQLVGSRRLSKELGDIVESVNADRKYGFVFDYAIDANGHPANIYCRSDHYEYARYGIPITFFTTGGHSDYHQVSDEPQYIDYQRMARVASLVSDVAVRVANLDHRIVVDQPKPDPRGACRQ
jgi:hypothetical protein